MTKVEFEDGTIVDYANTIYFHSRFAECDYYFKIEPENKITELQPVRSFDEEGNSWIGIYYFHYTMPDGCAVDIFDNYREISKDDFDEMVIRAVKLMLEKCEDGK